TTGPKSTTTTAPKTTTTEGALGLVPGESAAAVQQEPTTSPPPTTAPQTSTSTTAPPQGNGTVPLTSRGDDKADATVILPGKTKGKILQLGPSLANGTIVRDRKSVV